MPQTLVSSLDSSRENWQYYFDALNVLRGNLLNCILELEKISASKVSFAGNMKFERVWKDKLYLK